MHLVDGKPVVAATDLVGFLACEHLTNLERASVAGLVRRPDREDPELDMIARRGTEHEEKYLAWLARPRAGPSPRSTPGDGTASRTRRCSGAPARPRSTRSVAVTMSSTRRRSSTAAGVGFADFLLKVAKPSTLGAWSYEVADTKLARRAKADALLQLCSYTEQLTRIQGVEPDAMHVVLGGAGIDSSAFRVKDYLAYYRAVKARFEASVFGVAPATYPPAATYPDPVEHCEVCRWNEACSQKRRFDDHLSLVARLGGEPDQEARRGRRAHSRRAVRPAADEASPAHGRADTRSAPRAGPDADRTAANRSRRLRAAAAGGGTRPGDAAAAIGRRPLLRPGGRPLRDATRASSTSGA